MMILAIEDNPADVESLREILTDPRGSSFGIENARSLAEAKKSLLRGNIDFILLDLGLPDSHGIDTLRAVRTSFPSLPIVVLTGSGEDKTGMLALSEGAQDYLVKGEITGPSLQRSIRYANERNRKEQELIRKNAALDGMIKELKTANEYLHTLNKELQSTEEELKKNAGELTEQEQILSVNEAELKEALAEKEVLLSEIHHRVKNNLAAFISLLNIESSYEESPAGQALKKDLQNRAMSMALIHETLYRTRQFSKVDMNLYLSTLVNQVIGSYKLPESFRTVIDLGEIHMDLMRATPCGLIVNELVTNSLKYAFPQSAFPPERTGPSTVSVAMKEKDGMYALRVADNGIGLPPGFDIQTTQTLGLKLVNFLAHHQLRASIETGAGPGTEFVFRFGERTV